MDLFGYWLASFGAQQYYNSKGKSWNHLGLSFLCCKYTFFIKTINILTRHCNCQKVKNIR